MRTILVGLALALCAVALPAQEQAASPAFEVVSIRPHDPADGSASSQVLPGRYVARNTSVRSLLVMAYRVAGGQIVNGPGWIETERYDVEATMSEADAAGLPYGELAELQRQMIRTLLEERFGAVVREIDVEIDGHALVVDRADGRLGPQLVPSSAECPDEPAEATPAELQRLLRERLGQRFAERPCGLRSEPGGHLQGQGATIDSLLMLMRLAVGTPVVNETNLTGRYDIELSYDPSSQAAPAPILPGAEATLPEKPPLRIALEDQLGLRLEPRRIPAKGLEIIRIERPTPN